jgi:deoxyribose-phosphate aldolase
LEDPSDLPQLTLFCDKIKTSAVKPAGVCVYARDLTFVKAFLQTERVKLISVINFPKGDLGESEIQAEIEYALAQGATELDIVIPYRTYLPHRQTEVITTFMQHCRELAPSPIIIKFILEVGELKHPQDIYELSLLACESGADFVKTSTGKVKKGASPEVVHAILQAIKSYYQQGGQQVGIKISGGVRNLQQAMEYVGLVQTILGPVWLNPNLFRIGASQLFSVA